MNQLRERGIAIIYISHALGDVLRLCDDLVVLRDGEVVGGGAAKEFTHNRLVSLMVGRQLNQLYPERRPGGLPADSGEPPLVHPDNGFSESVARCGCLLQVYSVSQPGVVRDISFSLAAGEVLGIFGLMGAGRSELARMVFGLEPHSSGEVRLGGNRLEGNPRPASARPRLPDGGSPAGWTLHGSIHRGQHVARHAPAVQLDARAGWTSRASVPQSAGSAKRFVCRPGPATRSPCAP